MIGVLVSVDRLGEVTVLKEGEYSAVEKERDIYSGNYGESIVAIGMPKNEIEAKEIMADKKKFGVYILSMLGVSRNELQGAR